jgi:hypothetical protein
VGPAFVYYDQKYDFTFFEAIIYPIIGGMLGVFIFSFFSDQVALAWHWVKSKVKRVIRKREVFSDPTVDVDSKMEVHYSYVEKDSIQNKKIFTPQNRRLVNIWRRYGLFGIAFLTPVLISIPIGTIVASRLIPNKKKIFLYMFVSITFWSVAMVSFFELYHAHSIKALQKEVLQP